MSDTLFVLRIGELTLKGGNKKYFERKLRENIKHQLSVKDIRGCKITNRANRFYLSCKDEHAAAVETSLRKTFGIVGFSKALSCSKNLEDIEKAVLQLSQQAFSPGPHNPSPPKTFKIEARRSDKSFPLNSYEIAREMGSIVLEAFPEVEVDVKTPELTINVEIRENVYVFGNSEKSPGGLPVGSAGRGLLLLSGGIDSPVAGFLMGKRGLTLDAVYFHTYPYTSDEAKNKVLELARLISIWTGSINLFVVPFTEAQLHINAKAFKNETTLLMRASMMKIANDLAMQRNAVCLITGESLSQVASQTAQSMRFTSHTCELPVFRPLIGMDKDDIIRTAKKIKTYDTSILPYDDCCTIFSPKHPIVKPEFLRVKESYKKLEIDNFLEKALNGAERIGFHYGVPQ